MLGKGADGASDLSTSSTAFRDLSEPHLLPLELGPLALSALVCGSESFIGHSFQSRVGVNLIEEFLMFALWCTAPTGVAA